MWIQETVLGMTAPMEAPRYKFPRERASSSHDFHFELFSKPYACM
jgi:hypothetical protein